LDDLNVELEELKKLYEKQNETVEVLKESVEIKEAKMKELEHLLELYSNRLERASHLTEGLKQDKNNWIQYSKSYEQRKKNLQGDTLIYCAIMAYLSPFNKAYRDSEMKSWIGILKQNLLETSSDLRLINMISEPKIQNDWIKSVLPNDEFTLDNAVILLKSDR
jgi:dynein heavy chain